MKPARRLRGYGIEELEPRVLLSADAATLAGGFVHDHAPHVRIDALPPAPTTSADHRAERAANAGQRAARLADRLIDTMTAPPVAPTVAPAPTQVVFIDSAVKDIRTLEGDIAPGTEIVVLDAASDGVQQMAAYLQGRGGLGAIHVISEGAGGSIQLGSSRLDNDDLASDGAALRQIGAALAPGGDILFYGCDIAAGSDGQQLITGIAALTRADIAASTDVTGDAAQGGNWTLEAHTGDIRTATILNADTARNYGQLLANPSLSASGGTTAFVQNGGAVVIDPGITATSGGKPFTTATIRISTNYSAAQDVLAFTANAATMGNITATGNTGGVLTLTSSGSTASLAQWQTALESVTYNDTSTSPSTLNRTVQFQVTDSNSKTSALVSKTVSVTAVSGPLLVTPSVGTTAFTEKGGPVAVDAAITVTDTHSTTAASATVSIGTGFQAAQDALAFSNTSATTFGNITASEDAATGVLAMTSSGATATTAQWQAAFRAVTYNDSSSNPSTANRSIGFVLNDGSLTSPTAVKTVGVTAVDDPAVVTTSAGQAVFTTGAVVLDGGIGVSDVDNTTLSSAQVTITFGYSTEDRLAFTNTSATTFGNITATFNTTTSVLSMTSSGATATLAQWQAALSAVTYHDTSANPQTDSRTVSIQVTDPGGASSAAVTRRIAFGPVMTTSSGSTDFTPQLDGPVVVDRGVDEILRGTTTVASATVAITAGFQPSEDVLGFVASEPQFTGDIAGSFDATTGVLTLTSPSGTATIADFRAAMEAVTYDDTATSPTTATRGISFAVNTGSVDSSAATRTLVFGTPATFVVTNTNDSGAGSLRQAMLDANSHVGVDTIDFAIGSGPQTITLISGLPSISDGVSIDATTQPGFASAPLIVLDTSHVFGDSLGFFDGSSYSRLSGLVVQGPTTSRPLTISNTDHITITGNYFDTDAAGTSLSPGGNPAITDGNFIMVSTATDVVIGGTAAADANVIGSGINLLGSARVTIEGNAIGVDRSGTIDLGAATDVRINLSNSSYDTIGGTAAGAGNLVGNTAIGVWVSDSLSYGNAILGNSIRAATPIELGSGTPANDTGDGDTGANNLQNNPLIATVLGGTTTTVSGTLNSNALRSYRIEFFANSVDNPGGRGDGAVYLGATTVTTDASGNATYTVTLPVGTDNATPTSVSATATDLSTGDTSAFAFNVAVTEPPVVTTSAGTTAATAGNAVVVDSGITIVDTAQATATSASVTIATGLQSAEDVLAFDNTDSTLFGNIAAAYDAVTGVLSLTSSGASATIAQFQAALAAVTYEDTSGSPSTANRGIVFVLDDGTLTSNRAAKTVSVAAAARAPVVTTSVGTTGTVVGAAPVVVDAGIGVADGGSTTLASATVGITGHFVAGQDQLSFVNDGSTMGNVAASFDGATGILTMTSSGATATLAQWQAALRAVGFAIGASNADAGSRTVAFVVDDGQASSSAATRSLAVSAATPIVTTTAASVGYVENGAALAVDAGLDIADPGSPTLASATVSLTGNFAAGQDVLGFVNDGSTMGNVSAAFDAATGVLSLTSSGSTATLAQWQSALRSITYANTSDNPSAADRTIAFVVDDGTSPSASASRTLTVTPVDDAPVVAMTSGTTGYVENGVPLIVDGGITVTDVDSATLASATVSISGNFAAGQDQLAFVNDGSTMGNVSAAFDATTGVLSLTSTGSTATLAQWQAALRSITYANTSDNPSAADRTIAFVVDDGTSRSAPASRTLTVTPVDDAPVVATTGGATGYVESGVPLIVDSGVTVTDVDSATLTSATVSISGNFAAGQDQLAFVNDGSTMGNVSAAFDATTGVLSLTSSGSTATLAQWQSALRSITYADTSDNPSAADRTIAFDVDDGTSRSASASRTLTVTPVDDAPVVATTGGATGYVENGVPWIVDGGITVTDVDSATLASATVSISGNFAAGQDQLAFVNDGSTMGNVSAAFDAATGVLSLTSAGSTATLAQWQSALRSITYANTSDNPSAADRTIAFVVDDGTSRSAPASRTLTVTPVDDAPVVATTSGTTGYVENGVPLIVDGGITVDDVDSATLTSATVSISGNFAAGQDQLAFVNDGSTMGNVSATFDVTTGVLSLTSSGSTATLAQWQSALRSITYADTSDNPSAADRTIAFVVDDGTSRSAPTSRTLTVTPVDDAPVVATTSGTTGYVENGAPLIVDSGITVDDVDSATLASATVSISGNFAAGQDQLAFVNDGTTMGNVTATYDPSTGVLSMTSAGSTATLAQWQAALRAVTYVDLATTPLAGDRRVAFVVDDGTVDSAASIRTLSPSLIAGTPTVATSSGETTQAASAAPQPVDAGLVVADAGGRTLAWATVGITGNYTAGQDRLAFVNDGITMGNIAATYDAASGVLSLSSSGASATLAQWQSALRAVGFATADPRLESPARTVTFVVADVASARATVSRVVAVTADAGTAVGAPSAAPTTPYLVDGPLAGLGGRPPGPSDAGGHAVALPDSPLAVPRSASDGQLPATGTIAPDAGDLPQATTVRFDGGPQATFQAAPVGFAEPPPLGDGVSPSVPIYVRDAEDAADSFASALDDDTTSGFDPARAHRRDAHRQSSTALATTARHAVDDDPALRLRRRATEATMTLLSFGASWGLLRAAGLLASVAASRPLWQDVDPIALLPDTDGTEPTPPIGAGGPDLEARHDEAAARDLIDDRRASSWAAP